MIIDSRRPFLRWLVLVLVLSGAAFLVVWRHPSGGLPEAPPSSLEVPGRVGKWHGVPPPVSADVREPSAEEPGAPVSVTARFLNAQALLSLEHLQARLNETWPGSATDSDATILWSYGRVLFLNDYRYACRLCPELDPQAAETAYTNAIQALRDPRGLDTARRVVAEHPGPRPSAPMPEYERAFQDLPPETTAAYQRVLDLLQSHSPAVDPLTTDLFNDAVIYAMSLTELADSQEQIIAGFTSMARSEAATLEQLGQPPPEPAAIDPSLEHQFDMRAALYRDLFAYRFTHRHGLDGDRLAAELAQLPVPSTALWVHLR